MFSFNFIEESATSSEQSQDKASQLVWYQSIVHSLSNFPEHSLVNVAAPSKNPKKFTEFELLGVKFRKCIEQQTGIAGRKIDAVSDLIPGIYGGGLKIWECTNDLVQFMIKYKDQLPQATPDCKVLELGCGHGFPGITAMLMGYQEIHFSDLNLEVIEGVTWPNILLNYNQLQTKCICLAGNWLAHANILNRR